MKRASVLVAAFIVMPFLLGAAYAQSAPKVLVCKYVGKPGTPDEHLKNGKNPIEVSANSLPGYTGGTPQPGDEFADAQSRSVVVEEGTTECPGPNTLPPPPVRYKLVIRMTGVGKVRDRFLAPSGSDVSFVAKHVTCAKKITASFRGHIGSETRSYGPYTSKHGPVLRVKSEGSVLEKVRASDSC